MTSQALLAASLHLGTRPGPDLVHALLAAEIDRLGQLCELMASPSQPSVEPVQTEFWPLVNARTSTFNGGGSKRHHARAGGSAGLNLVSAMDVEFAGTGKFSSGLMRALLYCHGLVIEDPLAMAAEMFLDASIELRPLARTSVAAAAASMVEVWPLLSAGVVETFFTPMDGLLDLNAFREPLIASLDEAGGSLSREAVWDAFEAVFVEGLSPSLQRLWALVRAGDRSPPVALVEEAIASGQDPDLLEVFIDAIAEIDSSAMVENVVDVVAITAADLARFGSNYDVLCPSQLYADLFCLGGGRSVDALRLGELSRLEVPRLDDLLTEDVVRIRRESEVFAEFRDALSRGVERARLLRTDQTTPAEDREIVAETVAEARRRLFAETRRSNVLSSSMLGALSFVAGGLAGAAGAATGNAGGIAVGAAGGLLPPLVDLIARRSGRSDFLRRHYVVFEPAGNA